MKYDLLVFIGRFQPLHLGHQEVIERALSLSKDVLVLVGGEGKARSARNPLTFLERYNLIKKLYPTVKVRGIKDHTYNDNAWIEEVQRTVKEVALGDGQWSPDGLRDLKIGLIGCEKDHTSYYLHLFPDWDSESVHFVNPLNATDIRRELYEDLVEPHEIMAVMAKDTARWLFNEFKHTPEYEECKKEYFANIEYKKQWGEGPFYTADALVQAGGNILLVTRGGEFGHGMLALPGGFINEGESEVDAAVRELREETRLRVPKAVLYGKIINTMVADAVHRSGRARVISTVQHIKLDREKELPEVRGSDDAKDAGWYSFIELREDQFFEDHYHIIKKMLGL